MTHEMTELADRWILPLRGSQVVDISWGDALRFELDPPGEITVGYDALLTTGALTAPDVEPVPVSLWSSDELRQSIGTRVLSAAAFKSGALRVVFDDGRHLNVRSVGPFVPASVRSGDSVTWTRPEELAQN